MVRILSVCLVSATVLCSASGTAHAQPKTEDATSAAALENARDLYRRGVAKFSEGLNEDAYALFTASWALHPHYTTAGNLASCEMKLGKYRDAAAHLALALREQPADFAGRQSYEAAYAEARSHVGALQLEAKAGEEVFVDEVSVGRAPFADPVFVEPGAHTLRAAITRSVSVQAGEEIRVRLGEAAEAVKAPPAGPGDVKTPGLSPVIPIGIGLTALGLGTGIVLAALSTGHGSAADDAAAQLRSAHGACASLQPTGLCKDIQDDLAARDGLATGGAIAFIAGGAVGVGTLIYTLTQKKSSAVAPSVSLSPVVTPMGGSLTVMGRF